MLGCNREAIKIQAIVGTWSLVVLQLRKLISSRYYNCAFTSTQSLGATASFSFNGTFVAIYGTKGDDHGNYSVNIDGITHDGNGFVDSPNEDPVSLFNMTLRQGPHVVTLLNSQYSRLDIDSVCI